MHNITVVSKYKRVPNAIYCGRGSALGNPFKMNGEAQRDLVCDQYHEYFYKQVQLKSEPFITQLRSIWRQWMKCDIYLECYCAPKRCHCDTIAQFLKDEYVKKYQQS